MSWSASQAGEIRRCPTHNISCVGKKGTDSVLGIYTTEIWHCSKRWRNFVLDQISTSDYLAVGILSSMNGVHIPVKLAL